MKKAKVVAPWVQGSESSICIMVVSCCLTLYNDIPSLTFSNCYLASDGHYPSQQLSDSLCNF